MPQQIRSTTPGHRDVMLSWVPSKVPQLIRSPARVVGLHGWLPPGAVAVVAPAAEADALQTMLHEFPSWLTGGLWSEGHADGSQSVLARGACILEPGALADFGRESQDGVAVALCLPGLMLDGLGVDSPNLGPSAGALRGGPAPEPLLRLIPTGALVPAALPYRRAPVSLWGGAVATASPVGLALGDVLSVGTFGIPLGTRRVRVVFRDDAATLAPIQDAESGSYEVWWFDRSGQWYHSSDDDFDAAGTGVASADHSAEVFDVEASGVVGCYVRKTAGNDFWAGVVLS